MCKSKKILGSFPNYECLMCGKKFVDYEGKPVNINDIKERNNDKSRFLTSDCPEQCPKCQSTNLKKNKDLYICQTCQHFWKDNCE